jgi:hypothetical protein
VFLDQKNCYSKDYSEEQEEVDSVSILELRFFCESGLTVAEQSVKMEAYVPCAVVDHNLLDSLCCSCSSSAVVVVDERCCWCYSHTALDQDDAVASVSVDVA